MPREARPRPLRAQVLSLLAHAHWVTSATYNRFHDQLLLSCGTDSQVKLWRAAAISSAPPSLDYEERALPLRTAAPRSGPLHTLQP